MVTLFQLRTLRTVNLRLSFDRRIEFGKYGYLDCAPPFAGNIRGIGEEIGMPRAFLQVLRTTAAVVVVTVGIFGVLGFIGGISHGAALLDAATKALMVASGFGGIVGLILVCVLPFYRICPECRTLALVTTGRTRMEQGGSWGKNYEQEFHEYKCEECGYAKWVVHPAG